MISSGMVAALYFAVAVVSPVVCAISAHVGLRAFKAGDHPVMLLSTAMLLDRVGLTIQSIYWAEANTQWVGGAHDIWIAVYSLSYVIAGLIIIYMGSRATIFHKCLWQGALGVAALAAWFRWWQQ